MALTEQICAYWSLLEKMLMEEAMDVGDKLNWFKKFSLYSWQVTELGATLIINKAFTSYVETILLQLHV